MKGACKNFNRGLDCDVLVAEVCEELLNAKILTSRISSLDISQCLLLPVTFTSMFTLEFDAKTMEIMYDSVSYRVCAVYMTTLYSKSSVFVRPEENDRTAFSKTQL